MNARRNPAPRLGRAWAGLLLLALWLVPWFGQVHQIAHGPLSAAVPTGRMVWTATHHTLAAPEAASAGAHDGLHAEHVSCLVFDGLALGLALFQPPSPLPSPLPVAVVFLPLPTVWAAVLPPRHFEARAPPTLSSITLHAANLLLK